MAEVQLLIQERLSKLESLKCRLTQASELEVKGLSFAEMQ
jgi:hypothetical protein